MAKELKKLRVTVKESRSIGEQVSVLFTLERIGNGEVQMRVPIANMSFHVFDQSDKALAKQYRYSFHRSPNSQLGVYTIKGTLTRLDDSKDTHALLTTAIKSKDGFQFLFARRCPILFVDSHRHADVIDESDIQIADFDPNRNTFYFSVFVGHVDRPYNSLVALPEGFVIINQFVFVELRFVIISTFMRVQAGNIGNYLDCYTTPDLPEEFRLGVSLDEAAVFNVAGKMFKKLRVMQIESIDYDNFFKGKEPEIKNSIMRSNFKNVPN